MLNAGLSGTEGKWVGFHLLGKLESISVEIQIWLEQYQEKKV